NQGVYEFNAPNGGWLSALYGTGTFNNTGTLRQVSPVATTILDGTNLWSTGGVLVFNNSGTLQGTLDIRVPIGTITPPVVPLTPAQQLWVNAHKIYTAADLMVAVGSGLFVNSPTDPVWAGLYVNGVATTTQKTANSLQPTYDTYKLASSANILLGLESGKIVPNDDVYRALMISNRNRLISAYSTYLSNQVTPPTLTPAQQLWVNAHKIYTAADLMVAVGSGLFVNSPTDPVWAGLYVNGVATTTQKTANSLQPTYDAYKNTSVSVMYSGIAKKFIPEFGDVYNALMITNNQTKTNLTAAYVQYKQAQQGGCTATNTCPPASVLTPLQQKWLILNPNYTVADLLVAVGNNVFTNTPTDPVWQKLYVNGAATVTQNRSKLFQPTYDKYKAASGAEIEIGFQNGDIVPGGSVYDALMVSNKDSLIGGQAKYQFNLNGGSCVGSGNCPSFGNGAGNGSTTTEPTVLPTLTPDGVGGMPTTGDATTGAGNINNDGSPKVNENPPDEVVIMDVVATFSNMVGSLNNFGATLAANPKATTLLRNAAHSKTIGQQLVNIANNVNAKAAVQTLLDTMLSLENENPKLFNDILDALDKGDHNRVVDLLRSTNKAAKWAEGFALTFDLFGKVVLAPLTIGSEAGEFAAKVVSGTASQEDMAKWSINTGAAIYGTIASGAGAVALMGYGAIQAGKSFAEWRQGESFDDSQQRYLDNISSMEDSLTRLGHNQIGKYAQGASAAEIQTGVALSKQIILGQLETLNQMENDLNSTGNFIASTIAFSSGQRDEILKTVRNFRSELIEKLTHADDIALNQFQVGHAVFEIKQKQEISKALTQ
ncbi:MAG: hypothetical protein WAO71_08605, partial [Gallionella sp.]